ncbi:MAG: hypothetical protein DWC07_06940 [Candidatus Poseidoniales archaeon]|nr:MAG: hypothetical protein DWC07_06940 [Candidatus Poseidoniales archaeon]
MCSHKTRFGTLTLPSEGNEPVEQHRIDAELRGLCLLGSIIDKTDVWEERVLEGSDRRLLVIVIDGDEVRIDVIETVHRFLVTDDSHLAVTLYRGRNRTVAYEDEVCILNTPLYPDCAIADALVSLVLLGAAGWPESGTLNVLWRLTKNGGPGWRGRGSKMGGINLTAEDIDEIRDIQEAIDIGMPMAAVDMLQIFAQRLHSSKGVEMEDIKHHLKGLTDTIADCHFQKYAQHQTLNSDLLFLPVKAHPA